MALARGYVMTRHRLVLVVIMIKNKDFFFQHFFC